MSNARIVECSSAEYHGDTSAISHSGLDLVMESPAVYQHRKLSGLYVPKPEKHYADGSALDEALLRPCKFLGEHVVEIPPAMLAKDGTRRGKRWTQYAAANAGKVLVKSDEDLLQWVRAVQNHPAAKSLLEADGHYQHTIYWHDDEFDVERKIRTDFTRLGGDVVVDLKTTRTGASPRECANEVAKFGYHRQASYYQDGIEAMYGNRPIFVFIFVSKEPPYRVEAFELDDEFLSLGREQNAAGLKTYAECLRTGKWLPETHGQIMQLSPPAWVRHEREWSLQ